MTVEVESFGGPLSGLGDGDEKNCPISEPASAAAYYGVAMAPVARFSYPILPHRSIPPPKAGLETDAPGHVPSLRRVPCVRWQE